MKLRPAAALGLVIIGLGLGYLRWGRVSQRALELIAEQERRAARHDAHIEHIRAAGRTRDTLYLTRLLEARGNTDAILAAETPATVSVLIPFLLTERAACDTALAAKDTSIIERDMAIDSLQASRDDAVTLARRFARVKPPTVTVGPYAEWREGRVGSGLEAAIRRERLTVAVQWGTDNRKRAAVRYELIRF